MKNIFISRLFFMGIALGGFSLLSAQFKTRDRMDNLEGFDEKRFSWGFFLAGNFYDYKIDLHPLYGVNTQHKNLVIASTGPGFGAGLMGKARLNEYLDLRLEPSIQFLERKLTFDTAKEMTEADRIRKIKSTYIDIPLMLEVHGDRWYNSRPYVSGGMSLTYNLQSDENSLDDNQQGVFRTKSLNYAYVAEIGVQFYFKRFKLTPAVRGIFYQGSELIPDNASTPPRWAGAIDGLSTRGCLFVLKFE